MGTNINVTYEDIFSQLVQRLTNVSPLWSNVTTMMDRAKDQIFDSGGGWGVRTWPKISPSLYGRVRVGSNGQVVGLYSESSRPTDASGSWRNSFRRTKKLPLSMNYGSTYKMANGVSGDVIPNAGRGGRQPLPNIESGRFRGEMGKIENSFMNETIARSIASAATKKA